MGSVCRGGTTGSAVLGVTRVGLQVSEELVGLAVFFLSFSEFRGTSFGACPMVEITCVSVYCVGMWRVVRGVFGLNYTYAGAGPAVGRSWGEAGAKDNTRRIALDWERYLSSNGRNFGSFVMHKT